MIGEMSARLGTASRDKDAEIFRLKDSASQLKQDRDTLLTEFQNTIEVMLILHIVAECTA